MLYMQQLQKRRGLPGKACLPSRCCCWQKQTATHYGALSAITSKYAFRTCLQDRALPSWHMFIQVQKAARCQAASKSKSSIGVTCLTVRQEAVL